MTESSKPVATVGTVGKVRLIFKRRVMGHDDLLMESFETVVVLCPELHERLTRGGYGDGCDITDLVGVEIFSEVT